jgi:hypothetical protein
MNRLSTELIVAIAEELDYESYVNMLIAVKALYLNKRRVHLKDPDYIFYKDFCGNFYCNKCRSLNRQDNTWEFEEYSD